MQISCVPEGFPAGANCGWFSGQAESKRGCTAFHVRRKMSYIVFSRKFRPERFSEVAGQAHATETLERALETGRVGQAYLFSGPRGIGKTTIARILAKALNCREGIGPEPCNKCPSCLEIAKSSSLDVFEIDGASNRRIEEVRDLRENVKFSPARDRFKIYIIDEVHMLTNEAFNALLKTLEEPPDHVKFIFATTAPHKIPLTIISRCQRFELRRIPQDMIAKMLAGIAKKENIKAEKSAVEAVAALAAGSMRDAQSIFDQLSSSVEGKLRKEDVDAMLGIIPGETYAALGDAVIESDTLKALEITGKAVEEGKDIEQFVKSWIKYWRDILMIKSGCEELAQIPGDELPRLRRQSGNFSREELLKIIDILFKTEDLIKRTSSSRIPLEIAAAELTALRKNPGEKAGIAPAEVEKTDPAQAKAEEKEEATPAETPGPEDITAEALVNSWSEILENVKKESARVHAFLVEGKPAGLSKNGINVSFSKKFHMESCGKKENKKLIEEALERTFGKRLALNCVEGAASPAHTADSEKGESPAKDALDDPLVKEVSEVFKVDVLEVKEEKKS